MGLSLYFLVIIVILFGVVAVLIARAHNNNTYENLNLEEWDCPTCGFHVQAGNTCIYCNENKD
mgnify:FL=1